MNELDQKMIVALIRIANWCGNKAIHEAVEDVTKEAIRVLPREEGSIIGLPVIDPSMLEGK